MEILEGVEWRGGRMEKCNTPTPDSIVWHLYADNVDSLDIPYV